MFSLLLFNRVHDGKVKLKMAQTEYTLEEPGDVAKRIEKGNLSKPKSAVWNWHSL